MVKIAVMGDYESIYGFGALGMMLFPVKAGDPETAEKLKNIANSGYGIIYMTEALARELSEEIEKYREQLSPAIILIPGVTGNTGEGIQSVKHSVEQAVGSDILFGDEK